MNAELQITDARLEPIAQKVLAGERLTAEDGLALFQSHDLLAVGWLANHVREKRHGNICLLQRQPAHQSHERLRRALQALRLRPLARRSPGAYTFALEEIFARAAQGVPKAPRNFTWSAACIPIFRSTIIST